MAAHNEDGHYNYEGFHCIYRIDSDRADRSYASKTLAGDWEQASTASFPAATAKLMPLLMAARTISSSDELAPPPRDMLEN